MKTDMTKGNPMKIILLFSIPVLMGNLFQQFYNMVDTIIVGQYLGSKALAAVGSTGCIMFLVLGFANGIAQGFGVMASHAFGAKNEKLLKHYVALAIFLQLLSQWCSQFLRCLRRDSFLSGSIHLMIYLSWLMRTLRSFLREFSVPCPTMWLPVFCEASETARRRCTF